MRRALAIALLVAACGGAGRTPAGEGAAESAPPLSLREGGETLRVAQRTSAKLPGSKDALAVQLGDVTGGAVELVLAKSDGSGVLVTRSVRERDVVPFAIDGFEYELVVEQMHNELIGDDWVDLRVRTAGGTPTTKAGGDAVVDERARIEGLIDAVAKSGVVFIRNGSEHDAAAAADHLRTKWSRAGDRIATADEFIEQLGSRSSQTGEAYRVRLPDGSERDAGPWLHELLAAQPR